MSFPHTVSESDIESLARLLPGYRIKYFIAAGGMGAVYQAHQISLDRDVALKVLPRELGADLAFRKSFQTEARAMARLNHPNLISVYDSGEVDGMPYIVMEYVDGCSLFHSANGQAVDPVQAVRIVLAISEGLAHAHAAGIIHRDVKPANVLLNKEAVPKLGDFGLARPVDHHGTGLCMGTPGYTAPEVMANPQHADKRSDLYAVGVILYELLTGQLPGAFASPPSTVVRVDAEMDRIWAKATHADPRLRYPDMELLAADLKRWMESCKKPKLGGSAPVASIRSAKPGRASVVPVRPVKRQSFLVPAAKVGLNLVLLIALYFAWKAYEYRKNHPQVVLIREGDKKSEEKEDVSQANVDGPDLSHLSDSAPVSSSTRSGTGEGGGANEVAPNMVERSSQFPVGLWHNRRIPQIIVTLRQDGSCVTTMGHAGTWTWTGDSQVKTLRLIWTTGTIDTFSAAGAPRTLEGSNQSGSTVILDKLPDVAEVPIEKFLGDWIGSPEATSVWKFQAGGKMTILNYKTSSRTGDHTESSHTWERGPGGERITVFWEGNRRWFNVLTLSDEPGKIIGFNQRNSSFPLIRIPEEASGERNEQVVGALARKAQPDSIAMVSQDESIPGFACIPAGKFTRGGTPPESRGQEINISEYFFEKHEVSKSLWDKVRIWASARGYSDLPAGRGKGADHPVVEVGWYDAVKWCNARSEMDGLKPCYYQETNKLQPLRVGRPVLSNDNVMWKATGYRLPTEAEWEKAARGGLRGKTYFNGDTLGQMDANFAFANKPWSQGGAPFTSPCGSYPANGFGIFDVAGNVWEHGWDWFSPDYYSSKDGLRDDPVGPDFGTARILRGGCWNSNPPSNFTRVACRNSGPMDDRSDRTGFRTVCRRDQSTELQKSGSIDREFWKNKMLEDFPAMRDPKSKMMTKFVALRKDKEFLTPSFTKNANWTYQLAWDAALSMNDANPKYVDSKTPLFRGRFYKVFLEKCKWHEAQARCRAMKGRMVTIPDQETQTFVAKLAGGKYLWLGATEEKQEGEWLWSDGSKMNYKAFQPGEPNNYRGVDEDYLLMVNKGMWADTYEAGPDAEGYICEWWKANE